MRRWNESEDALSDLVTYARPPLSGHTDRPQPVSNWWARNGIQIRKPQLTREDLFAHAEEIRTAREPNWVDLLWHVLAWGVAGEFRNVPTVVRGVDSVPSRERLNELLAEASRLSYRGEIAAAYSSLHKKVPRLGPAFFTKYLYFTGDRASEAPRPLILDSRVTAASWTLTGNTYWAEKPGTYAAFCELAHRCSQRHACTPDEVEFRLYEFGVLIRSERWRWLRAEASLYREGAEGAGFADIVSRIAEPADR